MGIEPASQNFNSRRFLMALTASILQNLTPRINDSGKIIITKKADIDGLWIFVTGNKNGQIVKTWKFRSQIEGADRTMVLGTYPELGLHEARIQASALKQEIADWINPFEKRKIENIIKAEHSWRTSARTILDEEMHFPAQALELQRSHTNQQDRLRGAYARMTYIEIRRQAMTAWANNITDLINTDDDVKEIAKRYRYKG